MRKLDVHPPMPAPWLEPFSPSLEARTRTARSDKKYSPHRKKLRRHIRIFENTARRFGPVRRVGSGRLDRSREGDRRSRPSDEERPSVGEEQDQGRVELEVRRAEPL